MKHKPMITSLTVLIALFLGLGLAAAQEPQPGSDSGAQAAVGTAFTYQGRLADGGSPANGEYDFQFRLYDAGSGGSQVGSAVTQDNVTVTEGLFTVQLDFGDPILNGTFTGDARWLEIAVRPGTSTGAYTTLTPRQELTPTPYALYASQSPWSGLVGVPAGFADGVDDDTTYSAGTGLTLAVAQFQITPAYRLPQSCSSGQIAEWNGSAWACGDDDTGASGSFWSLSGNAGTTPSTHFLGTTDGVSLTLAVSGTTALRLEPNDTSPNLIGGYGGNSVAAGVVGATIGGGGDQGYPNQISGNYAIIDGGWSNLASGSGAAVGGGWSNLASGAGVAIGGGGYNDATGYYATVGGGNQNDASGGSATVGGGLGNQAAGYAATVGGGAGNDATGDHATVGGGGFNDADGEYATVGGGYDNDATGDHATVGGGGFSDVTGNYATVGGGYKNIASGAGAFVGGGGYDGSTYDGNQALGDAATIGGGMGNVITTTTPYATIGGGESNQAAGAYATVPGGANNVAQGSYSFAAGRRAQALHDGAIILADGNDFDFASLTPNTFKVRATGGIRFVLGINGSSGDPTWSCLVQDGSSWSCSSDRNLKENLILADGSDVLERLSQMPVYYWNAKGQATPHIGPMAQDFYAAYGVGDSDTHISTIDLDGVALAAIQGLYAQNQGQVARIEQLEAENTDLEARLAAVEQGDTSPASQPASTWLLPSGLAILAGVATPIARERIVVMKKKRNEQPPSKVI